MKSYKIIHSLNVKDIQTVAKEILHRKLSDIEIESVLDSIVTKIDWQYAIVDSISENIKSASEDLKYS